MSSSDRANSAQDAYGVDVEKQVPFESQTAVDESADQTTGVGNNGHGVFGSGGHGLGHMLTVKDGEVYNPHLEKKARWYQRLVDAGFEDNGIKPVPIENRTNKQYSNLFTIFFTSMLSLLP